MKTKVIFSAFILFRLEKTKLGIVALEKNIDWYLDHQN